VLKVIRLIEKTLQVEIKYEIKNTAINEIPYQHLNDNKIKRLGWNNKYNLNSSIKNTFLWYKKYFEVFNKK
jgi:nucleoside-diphosphate-sugar epimerase